jgi:hypothetical protein
MTNQITEAMIDAGAHVLSMATAAHLTGAPRTLAEQVITAALATETNGIVDDTPVPQSAAPDADLVERVARAIEREFYACVDEGPPQGVGFERVARAAIEALTATAPFSETCVNWRGRAEYLLSCIDMSNEAGAPPEEMDAEDIAEIDAIRAALVALPTALTGCADDQTWADVPVEALRAAIETTDADTKGGDA